MSKKNFWCKIFGHRFYEKEYIKTGKYDIYRGLFADVKIPEILTIIKEVDTCINCGIKRKEK